MEQTPLRSDEGGLWHGETGEDGAPGLGERLAFQKKITKAEIVRQLGVSWDFVTRWTTSPAQDVTPDRRGWPAGVSRLYSAGTDQRVLALHDLLRGKPGAFFTGATAIHHAWRTRYPATVIPSLRYIGRTLRKHGRTTVRQPRQRGAARYLCYPEGTLASLGASRLEVDFIGRKFLQGRTAPVHFLAFSLLGERKLKYFQRVEAETAEVTMAGCQAFFDRFERPDMIKIDNGFGFAASSPWPGTLSAVPIWLITQRVTPVFTAPRRPWNQASVEGANSVFARKFWNRFRFRSPREVDPRLVQFNRAYQEYLGYVRPTRRHRATGFRPAVYFIRKVSEDPRGPRGLVDLARVQVRVPAPYINLFVLAKWDLTSESLSVLFERGGAQPSVIHQQAFPLHPTTKAKLSGFI